MPADQTSFSCLLLSYPLLSVINTENKRSPGQTLSPEQTLSAKSESIMLALMRAILFSYICTLAVFMRKHRLRPKPAIKKEAHLEKQDVQTSQHIQKSDKLMPHAPGKETHM